MGTAVENTTVGTAGLCSQIRAGVRRVCDRARHVEIVSERVPTLLSEIAGRRRDWRSDSPVQFRDLSFSEELHVALVFNAISFCYWPDPTWQVKYCQVPFPRGTWSLLAAIRRDFDSEGWLRSFSSISELTEPQFSRIVRGKGRLPLAATRLEILREVASVVISAFQGDVANLYEGARGDAEDLAALLVDNFSSFRDEAIFGGRVVSFHKRAQLFAADAVRIACGRGVRLGQQRSGLASLTACADYMIPALLQRSGVLRYSQELLHRIHRRESLDAGGRLEVEIRAATLVAADLLADRSGLSPMEINDLLWIWAGEEFARNPAFHRTLTTAY